jgi:uncharacterized RDD family membrane protein YckC
MDTEENVIRETVKAETPITLKFAPGWKRFLAFLLDLTLLTIIIDVLFIAAFYKELLPIAEQKDQTLYFKMIFDFSERHRFQMIVATFIAQASYFSLFWKSNGQTLGAKILKIAVITLDKKRLSILQGIWKYTVIFIFSPLFYLPLIFTMQPAYHQKIHDILSNSVVVELPQVEEKEKKGKEQAEA